MKKVLIITYYWPPSGGGGVQRWLKFSNYLPDHGWNCLICTPEDPQFDQQDKSLVKSIHDETEVLKLPIWEPYKIFKRIGGDKPLHQGVTPSAGGRIAKFIRGNIFLPDPRVFWVRPAVRFLQSYLKERPVDLIVTTGPPHSMHLIGRKLREKTNIPWIADFRDPWSRWDMLSDFYTTGLAQRIHRRMERSVLRKADHVVTVSEPWAREFRTMSATPVDVVPNGYDPAEVPEKRPLPDVFRILHYGLLNRFRNASGLWRALDGLCGENEVFRNSLVLEFGGMVDPDVQEEITRYKNLQDRTIFQEAIPHEEMLHKYQESAVLLLLMNNSPNATGHIPGKLFEYLASGRQILAVGDPTGAAANLLQELGAGGTINWKDEVRGRKVLKELFQKFQAGTLGNPDHPNLRLYSRQHLTGVLVGIMEKVSKHEG